MVNEYSNIKVHAMLPEQLDDFVRNTARAGDVAVAYDNATRRRYMYFCTEDNIGKGANPVWIAVDERWIIENRLKSMTLEEKVDFLIDQYIENELCKLH